MKTMIEKQSAVLSKMYKTIVNEGGIRSIYKCIEHGITYYTFSPTLMIPCDKEVDIIGARIPEYSRPHFLEDFHHFDGSLKMFKAANIPDKKDLKEMIKSAGGMRINQVFQIKEYIDDFNNCQSLNDIRYIMARNLIFIYDFLDESKNQNIDICIDPAHNPSAFYFQGLCGSGYIMPVVRCEPFRINKED